jgi:hypothetical protein
MEDYTQKYLKYKEKYIALQKQYLKYTNIAPTIPNPISNTPVIKAPLIPNPIPNGPIMN